jgi:hypothetical protein
MNTTIKYVLSLVIVLGLGYIVYTLQTTKIGVQENTVSATETKSVVTDAPATTGEKATNVPVQPKNITTYAPADFVWKSEPAPQKGGIPKEKISLEVKGKVYTLGEFQNCNITKPFEQLESGQVSKINCWYGGGGNELVVYNENGSYSIKKRWTQESGGPEVGAQPYGPWEVVTKLP